MKNRLEEIRKERGIKQEELAAALEVSRQTIGDRKRSLTDPFDKVLQQGGCLLVYFILLN